MGRLERWQERVVKVRGDRVAFGAPGAEPRWAHSNKDGVGTAYSGDSRLWFTLWNGVLTEAYYPTIDRPQLRDLQLLFSDGSSFVDEEKRDVRSEIERIDPHALGYEVRGHGDRDGYSFVKEVIAAPHLPCLLQRIRFRRESEGRVPTSAYVHCAPHLEVGGWGNSARVYEGLGDTILVAEKGGTWLALGASPGFARATVGYVGESDGFADLMAHKRLTWEFDAAPNGNVALTGEIPLAEVPEVTVGLAFGGSLQAATSALYQSIAVPFDELRQRFVDQWKRVRAHLPSRAGATREGAHFFHGTYSLLLAHEDKTFPGAFIASLSIPWGAANGDPDQGGYHLVWTRDLVQTATALLAAGNRETALRALIYVAACQQADGGFPQNFWLNGEPYWTGVQLDEVAFPILLAYRLQRAGALGSFDPIPLVAAAARYLIVRGPATGQDRWEELAGYSPSTLAAMIAAFVAAAALVRESGDVPTAGFLEEYADFLEAHLEGWTVTRSGTLVPGVPTHYVRIQPIDLADPTPTETLDGKIARLRNVPPGERAEYPANEIVDAGFLELVRYGIRAADDPVIVASLRVVDALLKVETPAGPCWRRYNHDGYGQAEDGGPFLGSGRGRAWPLLTGERGHYELAAGRDARPYLRTMERLATGNGLLAEQVWDAPDLPGAHQFLGRPTESALPLAWAHAEYAKLWCSVGEGRVLDRIPEVEARYLRGSPRPPSVEVWSFRRQPATVAPGRRLRIVAEAPFRLRWSDDDWAGVSEIPSRPTGLGIEFVDLVPPATSGRRVRFTFQWPEAGRWEGRDFVVVVG